VLGVNILNDLLISPLLLLQGAAQTFSRLPRRAHLVRILDSSSLTLMDCAVIEDAPTTTQRHLTKLLHLL